MEIAVWKLGKAVFVRKDAEVIVPLLLFWLALGYHIFNAEMLFLLIMIYYLLYFFSRRFCVVIASLLRESYKLLRESYKKIVYMRCSNCKSRKILLQGYNSYHSDEYHAFYLCTKCGMTCIETLGGLTHETPSPNKNESCNDDIPF